MTGDAGQAIEAIRRLREFRGAGKVEAVLRSEFLSWLRRIFPEAQDQTWINHYSEGTEAATKVGKPDGDTANRFIDNLIGSTTIEYEADLRVDAKYKEGYWQVREHVSGLIRKGVPISQVRGILSDTVAWHAYDVELAAGIEPENCEPADVLLQEVDHLELGGDDEATATRLISFVRKHLAREQSRVLLAEFLTTDLGLQSSACKRNAGSLRTLVEQGRKSDPSIALATDLWSRFVDYLEGEVGEFRAESYVDEIYLCVLARLLSANVLVGHAIASDQAELKSILNGTYFQQNFHLANMVEQDYFGWLTTRAHIDELLPIATTIQHDLYAYDFSWRPEEDLFGRLMAELAKRSQRRLLGQEWTPTWLGRQIAERCLANLTKGEKPRILDMCCGSGSIIAEVLKVARDHFGLCDIDGLHDVVTGFDIDPLAVSLSKTTWVITLADEIKTATAPIIIPIYHADSLFAVTPVTPLMPFFGESDTIELSLDGMTIEIPAILVEPTYRELFDRIVDWSYDEAIDAQTKGTSDHLTSDLARTFVRAAASVCKIELSDALEKSFTNAVDALVRRMANLAIARRNGIWAFILRNTYRPGLLSGQFNGIASNPPWLALSALADNPYKDLLRSRADLYGIRPAGQSFLHLELGTTHLLHAVDRYLSNGASIACLVPGTIFNGHHHEPFRQRNFLTAGRRVEFEINEAWQIEPGTFKYPSAAVVGYKRKKTAKPEKSSISGFVARESGLEKAEFSIRKLGDKRTAWTLEKGGNPAATVGDPSIPLQGADLMPRTAVCVEVVNETGAEYRVDTPSQGSPWEFTVKAAKALKGERFPGHIAPEFIYRMAQSENLLPFVFGDQKAYIALPSKRSANGTWELLAEKDIRGMGFTETARRFRSINDKLANVGKGSSLQDRIDERGKLSKQEFGDTGNLILAGAGGKFICAACIPVSDTSELVIDQTLYWQIVPDEDKAWFITGMLNSDAMTHAILPFNPKGAFGERHIHTLPYRIMPPFDSNNDDQILIGTLARKIAAQAHAIITSDAYLRDPNKSLSVRRRRLRNTIRETGDFKELDSLSAGILGTTTI